MKTSKQQKDCYSEMNLVKLIEQFGSEDKCRKFLVDLRWPRGVKCPRCNCLSVSRIEDREQWDCTECRYQFSVTSLTIFHDTHLPLWKWFLCTYLMVESKKGMSANQLKRTLGVSYKTAWFLCHRIRKAMNDVVIEKLKGTVEIDETFVGGKAKGKGMGYTGNKAIAVGAIQRGGKLRLQVVHSRTIEELHAFIAENTEPTTEAYYTDEHAAYQCIADEDTIHETVNHHNEEWVRGDVHTNGIESVWSLLKRSIIGSYHKVSMKHLDRYLDELEHRFNNRNNDYLFRDTLQKLVESENLTYQELTKAA